MNNQKETKVLTVGYQVPGHSDEYLYFKSRKSLIDADLVIFSPTIDSSYSYDDSYQGKTTYSQSGSFQLKEDILHWKKELNDFVKSGHTAIILLDTKVEFFLHTGQRTFSGSGRSRVTTNHVDLHTNYEALPIVLNELTSSQGREVLLGPNVSEPYKVSDTLKDHLGYRVYFRETESINTLYTTKDKSRIIAGKMKVGKGNYIFLPYFSYNEQSFTEIKNKNGKDTAYWNKKGLKFGQELLDLCFKIDTHLSQEENVTPPPDWSKEPEYLLPQELALQEEISTKSNEIEKIQAQKDKLQIEVEKLSEIRGLLYDSGKPLEGAVTFALKILGFQAEGYDDGELELDQVIISPEKVRYIGECEGKDAKPVNIDKLRQLIESMNADFAREEVDKKAYGILFGNPNRFTSPSQRAEWFTVKCLTGAKREGIALVKTPDLFSAAQYLMDNKNETFAAKCRESITNGLGGIVELPTPPQPAQLLEKTELTNRPETEN
jgi:hypothetical protein